MCDSQSFPSTYGETEAAKEDVVQKRVLLDIPASEGVKQWMDNFFLNQAYGAFCMNILADIFVRLFLLIFTYLALLRCWRAKERESRLTDLQFQQSLDSYSESHKRFFDSYFRSESFIRRVSQAATSDAGSSSTPAPLDVPSNILQGGNVAEVSRGCYLVATEDSTLANSSNALPTEKKRPLRKRQNRPNGCNYDCHIADGPRSLELASTSPSAGNSSSSAGNSSSSSRTVPTQALKLGTGDDVVIDILPVQGVFPTSASMATGNKFKQIMKVTVGVSCDHDISSSRIIQARVRATDKNLRALHDVAVEGMKLDKDFTLQIGGSFLYYCDGDPEEPALVSLRCVEMPAVLQADYSAGVLTIRGRHLEDAEIRAATFDGYMILNLTKQDRINNNIAPPESRIEVWRCTDLLPPVKLNQIQICASKTVLIEELEFTVRSEISSIQNTTLRTVIRHWVPTATLVVFLATQAWILLELLLNMVKDSLHRTWLFYLVFPMAIFIIQFLSPSLEDNIQNSVERLKLAISSFHVFPDLLSSPAFLMRSGYCFQWSARNLIKSNLKKEDSNKRIKSVKKVPNNKDKLPTSKNWQWPCFIEEDSKSRPGKKVMREFDPDSREETQSRPVSHPFTVNYFPSKNENDDSPLQYIPQNIVVKLYSKYLQAVIRDLLPNRLKLFENYGEIQASHLLLLHINKVLVSRVNPETESNDSEVSNDENCLDVYHLIRFLKKEYEKTITHYHTMMEAGIISWDMLWTLFMQKADVIFYCDISKEELCGKVLSTDYKLENRKLMLGKGSEFVIQLEAFDYNFSNFEAKRIKSVVLPFKDVVKISDMDVYPLQHKPNTRKQEESFRMRGRKYYDMVLKCERQFMQYQGLMYRPSSKYFRSHLDSSNSSSWGFSDKESIDGRVMIDQGVFARMEPMKSMQENIMKNEQQQEVRLQVGELKMNSVIDESDPLLKYAPAVAYGYSFQTRKWGCFTIEGFSKIQFVSTAFDTLVMDEDIKNTLLTLSEHYIKNQQGSKSVANVDPLPNKGRGCIILLHGPPGTGKTLTVESLAEKLECPIWQLSISRISKSIEQLETYLLRIFEIAALWRAILVLDEADIYLSSRKYSPLSSDVTSTNAMTGVFLRVLEYYSGILFLTTNVIDSIEPAIYSRMSLFVKYTEFGIGDRKLLWINFLNRIGFHHPSQEFWDKVLHEKFNGRVIRNIIQNAQILAKHEGNLLSEEHLLKACHVMSISFKMDHLFESEDKPDPQQEPISTYAPSVVTNSTIWRNEE